jgi:hypothetical protein
MNTDYRTELDCDVPPPVAFATVYTCAEDMPRQPSNFRRRHVAAGAIVAALVGLAATSSFMPAREEVQLTSHPANVTLDAK